MNKWLGLMGIMGCVMTVAAADAVKPKAPRPRPNPELLRSQRAELEAQRAKIPENQHYQWMASEAFDCATKGDPYRGYLVIEMVAEKNGKVDVFAEQTKVLVAGLKRSARDRTLASKFLDAALDLYARMTPDGYNPKARYVVEYIKLYLASKPNSPALVAEAEKLLREVDPLIEKDAAKARNAITSQASMTVFEQTGKPNDPRKPLPAKIDQALARRNLNKELEEDYRNMTRDKARNLSVKLLEMANAEKDSARQACLLAMALELSPFSRDLRASFVALERMAKIYRVDRLKTLESHMEAQVGDRTSKEFYLTLAVVALGLAEDCLVSAQDDEAHRFALRAIHFGDLAEFVPIKNAAREYLKRATRAKAERSCWNEALEAFAKSREDRAKALEAGKGLCLVALCWEKGLPALAASSDLTMAGAARADLAKPNETYSQMALGDRWWEAAKKLEDIERSAALRRAQYWYEQAMEKSSPAQMQAMKNRIESTALVRPGIQEDDLAGEALIVAAPKRVANLQGVSNLTLRALPTGEELARIKKWTAHNDESKLFLELKERLVQDPDLWSMEDFKERQNVDAILETRFTASKSTPTTAVYWNGISVRKCIPQFAAGAPQLTLLPPRLRMINHEVNEVITAIELYMERNSETIKNTQDELKLIYWLRGQGVNDGALQKMIELRR